MSRARAIPYLLGLFTGASLAAIGSFVLHRHAIDRHVLAQTELVDFEQRIQPGMPERDVEMVFETRPYRTLVWRRTSPKVATVATPNMMERNWLLDLEFASDRLSAMRYRTPDGGKPPGSPPDRTIASAK